MSFLKRLYFFLFGLSIGIMILIFVINKKDTRFNYSPNKRVLNDIYKKNWVFNNQSNAFSKEDIEELTTKAEADVDVNPEAEISNEETEISLDELKDNEANTEDTDPTNS